jgi:hypothetical protein
MPINTDNARALVGGRGHTGKSWVRMLKGTQVHSVGRGVVKGEKVEVSEEDARYLVAYNYAERLQDPVVEREGITLTGADNKESSANPAVATEGITLTGADNKESSSSSASVNFASASRQRSQRISGDLPVDEIGISDNRRPRSVSGGLRYRTGVLQRVS